jgi:hypothetical protein
MFATYAARVRLGQNAVIERPSVARFVGPTVMTIGAMIAIVASFAPWLQSGAVTRNSYDLLSLTYLLRIAHRSGVRVLIHVWPLVPLMMVAAVVAAWWRWRFIAACVGLVGGIYAGVLSGAVALAVHDRYKITITAAPAWTAIGAATLILGSLIIVFIRIPSGNANSR